MFLRIKHNLVATYQFLRRHPGALIGVALVSVSLSCFVAAPAHGAGLIEWTLEGITNVMASLTLQVANLFLRISLFMLSFIMEISAYNGYLNATAVNVGWVMVRDITNMLFVIILLIIAFGTILGIEQYEWKKLIVKFVLAAVFVNFSRIICGVFIDISQLVMTTFVNGIAATAGGNLINAFSLEKITKISASTDPSALRPGIFTASLAAVVFAGMVMAVLAIFVFMLVARVIRLWVLIVLSPVAFVMSVIPITQKFASNWWSEFGDDLVTGPVLLFFIWLSFVTVGSGKINEEMTNENSGVPEELKIKSGDMDKLAGQSAGIGDAMGWNDMANFAIGIGMLIAGAKVAASIGGSSGSALTGVTSFGKKVATIASGVATGQWLYGKGKEGVSLAGKGLAGAAYYAPYIGGEKIMRKIKKEALGVRSWAALGAYSPETRPIMKKVLNKETGKMEETGEAERWENGDIKYEMVRDENGDIKMQKNKRGFIQRAVHSIRENDIRSQKNLEKVAKQTEVREGLTKARVRARPRVWAQYKDERADAMDRAEQGELDAEKMRSEAKTKEFAGAAKTAVLERPRWQEGKFQEARPGKPLLTMADQIAKHNLGAETAENAQKKYLEQARGGVIKAGKEEQEKRAKEIAILKEGKQTTREREVESQVNAARAKVEALLTVEFKPQLDALNAASKTAGADEASDMSKWSLNKLEGNGAVLRQQLEDLLRDNPALQTILTGEEADEKTAKEVAAFLNPDGTVNADYERKRKEGKIPQEEYDKRLETAKKLQKDLNDRKAERETDLKKAGMQDKYNAAKSQQGLLTENVRVWRIRDGEVGAERKKIQDKAKSEAKLDAALHARDMINSGQDAEHEKEAKSAEHLAKVAEIDRKIETVTTRKVEGEEAQKAEAGKQWVEGKLGKQLSEHELKALEEEIMKATLAIPKFDQIFAQIEKAEMGEAAAKGFIDVIKQQHIADIFKKGGEELKKAVQKVKSGESFDKVAKELDSVGARAALAEMQAAYHKENIAGITKAQATDQAESMWSLERVGYEIPATAMKKATKKQMEALETVEREKAAGMAADSVKHISYLKASGKELTVDQQANYMASVKFLVKNGWSDDLLGRLVDMVDDNTKGLTSGKDQEAMDHLQKLIVDEWGWGKINDGSAAMNGGKENLAEKGKLIITNESSGSYTNDLHSLMALGGDNDTMMAEKAVLAHKENQARRGKIMTYEQAADDLAQKIRVSPGGVTPDLIKSLNLTKLAAELEWGEERVKRQLSHFADSFALKKDVQGQYLSASKALVDQMRRYSDQMEMLTEIKQEALGTTHLDDAGHGFFDMQSGFAHGVLHTDAYKFMLGEFAKVDANKRVSNLKIHGIARMNEHTKTASHVHAGALATTFAGIVSRIQIEKLDPRNQLQILKQAWDEKIRNNRVDNALIIGDADSDLSKNTYGHVEAGAKRKEAVEHDVADDFAVWLENAPRVLLGLAASRSGMAMEDGLVGKVKMDIAGANIRNLEELVSWVNEHRTKGKQAVEISSVRAKLDEDDDDSGGGRRGSRQGGPSGSGGGGGGGPTTQLPPDQAKANLVQSFGGAVRQEVLPEIASNKADDEEFAAIIEAAVSAGVGQVMEKVMGKTMAEVVGDIKEGMEKTVREIATQSGAGEDKIVKALQRISGYYDRMALRMFTTPTSSKKDERKKRQKADDDEGASNGT